MTADRSEPDADHASPARPLRLPVRLVLGFALLVALMVSLSAVSDSVSSARGMIDATVLRTGTTGTLECRARLLPVKEWICHTDRIDWSAQSVPTRVDRQKPPYRIVASSDLTGTTSTVTSHSRSRGRTAMRAEVLVAAGHPVGTPLGPIVFLAPGVGAAIVVAVVAWGLSRYRRFRSAAR